MRIASGFLCSYGTRPLRNLTLIYTDTNSRLVSKILIAIILLTLQFYLHDFNHFCCQLRVVRIPASFKFLESIERNGSQKLSSIRLMHHLCTWRDTRSAVDLKKVSSLNDDKDSACSSQKFSVVNPFHPPRAFSEEK